MVDPTDPANPVQGRGRVMLLVFLAVLIGGVAVLHVLSLDVGARAGNVMFSTLPLLAVLLATVAGSRQRRG